ncbi:ABC transporter substrate-binding protein [Tomitella biformata]|uniref:ABC transporter substrate-binding protein n=1 Tax=Tomitella biformata TaxID=630403 RepID=UPI00046380A2|nr:ABC transporter substrate-binding protein [Tomitella biformata]
MRRPPLARTYQLLAALTAAGLLIAGCSSSGSDAKPNAESVTNGVIGVPDGDGDPRSGGTIAYAGYSSVNTLDPADRQDGGSTGGTEMAAIYDLLVRYDQDTHEYVPQLAKSLTANGDNSVWTLTLRDGATFSDGTSVDADAVIWSIERYLQKKGTHAQVWAVSVDSMSSTGPSTVQFTLKRPWAQFPALFTSGPGMIVAPSAMASGEFQPVGAGPFTLQKHTPQEELSLTARKDYWGGTPYLDTLTFPAIVSEQTRLDSLHSGNIQAAYIRNPKNVRAAENAGDPGAVYTVNIGGTMIINNREGRPGEDERVRQALVAAFDPEAFNQRVQGGDGLPSSYLFGPESRWHDDQVAAAGYDPEKAKSLLEAAKADGFDGKLNYVGMNDPETKDSALAVQAMLNSVGFDVQITYTTSIADLVKTLYAQHDYDISYSGFNVLDDSPFVRLYGNLHSQSGSNVLGYSNPAMDALLEQVQTATDDDNLRTVLADIQTLVDETAPMAVSAPYRFIMPFTENVRGVQLSSDGILLFDKAWTTE